MGSRRRVARLSEPASRLAVRHPYARAAAKAFLPYGCRVSGPEAGRNLPLLFADRVGIDRRGRELGMAEPALHEIQGDPFFDTGDTKPVPQPFGARLGARNASTRHDLDNAGGGRFQAPRPEMRPGGAVGEAVDQIEGSEERGRDWHGTVEAETAFLLALEGEDRRLEI